MTPPHLIYQKKIVTMHGMVANPSVIEPFPMNINSWVNLTLGQPHLAKQRGIVGGLHSTYLQSQTLYIGFKILLGSYRTRQQQKPLKALTN